MTKKDYVRFAKIIKDNTLMKPIRDNQPLLFKKLLIEDLCVVLKQDNSLFDRQRFINACE